MAALRASALAIAVTIGAGVWARDAARGTEPSPTFKTTQIPHHDGSGRATIIEIDPDVPGARQLLEAHPEAIPLPGEIVLPPRATPQASPTPPRGL